VKHKHRKEKRRSSESCKKIGPERLGGMVNNPASYSVGLVFKSRPGEGLS